MYTYQHKVTPIFFHQLDSLSIKNKITKNKALLVETLNRPEPP